MINLLLNNVLIFKSLYNYQIELDELKEAYSRVFEQGLHST